MEPLGRKPKNRTNKVLETIRITREEYNDYKSMEAFLAENQLLMKYEMYLEVVRRMNEDDLLINDMNNEIDRTNIEDTTPQSTIENNNPNFSV